MITGVVAAVKWSYYTAAAINGYRVTKSKHGQWTAAGTVVVSDAFKLAQRPLVFEAKHAKGAWVWPIQTLTIADGRLTAQLGPPLP